MSNKTNWRDKTDWKAFSIELAQNAKKNLDAKDDELEALRAQLEQERARVAELEKCVDDGSDAWLLRKQAEAVEAAAKECMPGPCGPPDDPPAGYQEYCEGVASVRDYAQRLRQQAHEIEGSEKP